MWRPDWRGIEGKRMILPLAMLSLAALLVIAAVRGW